MNTRDTVVRVCGMPRCAKVRYRTRTHVTHFGNTAGLPVPVLNANCVLMYPVPFDIVSPGFVNVRSLFKLRVCGGLNIQGQLS